jgi:hypothetical protein
VEGPYAKRALFIVARGDGNDAGLRLPGIRAQYEKAPQPKELKIAFETTTAGDNLALCAGTAADFAAGQCAIRLSDSGGPGFTFLTIVDAATLNGKILFVFPSSLPVRIRP